VIEATNARGIFGDKVWLDGMNLSEVNQLPDTLLPTGSRDACVTEEGLFDMVGNLHEWVADADGTFRGGFYMDTTHNGDGCSYRTTAHDFNYHDYSTGFRCCADPESVE
jgi:formylglycine-generating enzyme required for sulfatase activity